MSHAEKLLKSKDIARVMEAPRGQDSSREFTPKHLHKWAYEYNMATSLSRPVKPTDNSFIASFNNSLWDTASEYLSLNDMPLAEFIQSIQKDKDL
ncbi:hypothetical protein OP101_004807 [Salmonella enterica]|nr:hypothetical protein [Salmonella enterica]EKC4592101.1 hypothetical protein [Salmonella enterica]EKC4634870.1 hypothetical protein [Salmonella enterica]